MLSPSVTILLSFTLVTSSAFMQARYILQDNKSLPSNQVGGRHGIILEASATSSDKKNRAALRFVTETTVESDPVPLLPSIYSDNDELDKTSLHQFFRQKETIQVILGGAAGNLVESVDNNILLENMDKWSEQCKFFSSLYPSIAEGDGMYYVNTDGMSFPGLTISSVALIGATVSPVDNEFQFVLINTEQKAKGSKLLVWTFNKLTGNDKTPDDDSGEEMVHSLTQVTFQPTAEQDTAIFKFQTSFEISVQFSSLLLKILPVSKEKAEEQGSASILKALKKDFDVVVPKIAQVYLEYQKLPKFISSG